MKKEAGLFVCNDFGDRYLYPVNRTTFDRIGYENVIAEEFGKDFYKEASLYVVIGSDSGLFVKHLLKKGFPDNSRFIFVEPKKILERLQEVLDFINLPNEIAIVPIEGLVEKLKKFNFNDYAYLDNVFTIKSVGAKDAFWPEYVELSEKIGQLVCSSVWTCRNILGTQPFKLRKLENLGENRISAKILMNSCQGKTAIVLGGGPSLDNLLPWVKKNEDRLTVLSVSRISRRLLEFGLTPQVIFSIDPHPVSFDVSRETLEFWDRSLLVCTDHTTPVLLGNWRGKRCFLGSRFFWDTSLNSDSVGFVGPTVGNTALCFAAEMGFSRILLAGIDFCLSRDGYSHARGSKDYDAGPKIETILKINTNDGDQSETREDFLVSRDLMSAQCGILKKHGVQIFNLSGTAAVMENVEYLPPESIEFSDQDCSMGKILLGNVSEETSEDRISYYNEMSSELERVKKNLQPIRRMCLDAIEINHKLFSGKGTSCIPKYRKKLDAIEKKLDVDHHEFSLLVRTFGIASFLRATSNPGRDKIHEEDLERFGREYYTAYHESSDQLIRLIEDADLRLKIRIEEEKEQPDFDRLAEQWLKDEQLGRFLIWCDRHPNEFEKLTDSVKSKLFDLDTEYGKLARGERSLSKRFESKGIKFKDARLKANILFYRRDHQALERLQKILTANLQPEMEPVLWLVEGYLAELCNKPREAFTAYEKIVELGENQILEDALISIASLSLKIKDFPHALLAMECLTGISPTYLSRYAELLKVSGHHEEALDVYAEYLDRFPEDVPTLLRLANYYKELDHPEAVRAVLEHLLEIEPNNKAARLVFASLK